MTPFLSAYPVAPREYQPTPRGYQSPAFDLILSPTFTSQLHRKYKKNGTREQIDTLKLNHTLE
jgi:hypothetical protein